MHSFRVFAIANGVLACTLFTLLLFAPEWILLLFGMQQSLSASVLGRRAAMLFLGYGILSIKASKSNHSHTRQAILLAIGTSMLGLACMGLFEYVQDHAKWPILLAMAAELFYSAWAFFIYTKSSQQTCE